VDTLEAVRERPWRPVDDTLLEAIALGDARAGTGFDSTSRVMAGQILPFHSGNNHPRFFGWAQGGGNPAALMAEIVAATMNSNCGGRDHGAVYVEREVIRWTRECFGFPADASGVLVTGTSQATVLALAAARERARKGESRARGLAGGNQLTLYAKEGAHNAVTKAAELIGIGAAGVRWVPLNPATDAMDMKALAQRIARDRKNGEQPFCVVGTAGSVDRGSFDPLGEIAQLCAREELWFHVDGAFGAWTRIADAPWNILVEGIDRADSIGLDFHKWMSVQYDCGLILMRDAAAQRAAFAARPAYLEPHHVGLAGGDPWFCDFGIDLSRGFRALKVWATLRSYGREALGAMITDNCRLAARMGELVNAASELALAHPVRSNVCCFSVVTPDGTDPSTVNAAVVQHLQLAGDAVFSTTRIQGRTVIRAAIINHRTGEADVEAAIAAVQRAYRQLVAA
jgi:glutamate/tyrosine decarboxylase-like PLP-dependent enzyme